MLNTLDLHETAVAALGVFAVYAGCAILSVVTPGPVVKGYVCDAHGEALRYRLNGVRVLFVAVALFFLGGYLELWNLNVFYRNYGLCALFGCIYGLVMSTVYFVQGLRVQARAAKTAKAAGAPPSAALPTERVFRRALTVDAPVPRAPTASERAADQAASWWAHFYAGMAFNPRTGALFDHKMYYYLAGAVMLQLMLLSGAATHFEQFGVFSSNMVVFIGLWTWFVVEYLFHEHVHLYTYDLFAEKLGFKLTWGCFAAYPFFYGTGILALAESAPGPNDLSTAGCVLASAMFLFGWSLTRGANMQKYYVKCGPTPLAFLGIKPKFIDGTKILVSGFWGLSRHINYLGEILQGAVLGYVCWSASGSPVSWGYFLFITSILLPRQVEDDRLCEAKYGAAWKAYVKLVPARVVPYVW